MNPLQNLISTGEYFLILAVIVCLGAFGLVVLAYFALLLWKHRGREERSLDSVLLQVSLPADNEIKIDVAEQMFASLFAIKKGGWFSFLRPQEHISFEIVAKHEDIRFYVSLPSKLRDMVEKQIYGAYPGAEVVEVPEYSFFSEKGKVAFASFQLRKASYYPIKVYKDLATDSLSSITSALAKMGKEEGAAIQVLISPAESKWQKQGKAFIAKVKKEEASPESAKFRVDAKTLEGIDNKCSKPGFETAVRIVVSASTMAEAKTHLANIKGAFEQFSSDLNGFKKRKHLLKKAL